MVKSKDGILIGLDGETSERSKATMKVEIGVR
jgi:hypothetical protein